MSKRTAPVFPIPGRELAGCEKVSVLLTTRIAELSRTYSVCTGLTSLLGVSVRAHWAVVVSPKIAPRLAQQAVNVCVSKAHIRAYSHKK